MYFEHKCYDDTLRLSLAAISDRNPSFDHGLSIKSVCLVYNLSNDLPIELVFQPPLDRFQKLEINHKNRDGN